MKTFLVHALVLALSVGSASYVWLREKAPAASVRRDVTVWRGRSADVEKIELTTKKGQHIVLEGKSDAVGRYFIGTADAEPRVTFVSVAAAGKIADKLGELKALRDLGAVADRAEELGVKEPDSQLRVTVRGTVHTLDLGVLAPGGTDRYARDPATNSVYVIEADPLKDLEGGDHTLSEGQLHEFPLDPDVDRITITSDEKKRAFVRRGSKERRFFADPATPEKNEESATTFMAKIERLHPNEYVTTPPTFTGERVRLEYSARSPLGFLEIARGAGAEGDVYIRTERTRLWAKTTRTLGEQVLSDVPSIVR